MFTGIISYAEELIIQSLTQDGLQDYGDDMRKIRTREQYVN